jgi:aspartate-semialdehyde dehydrogenase
MAAKFTTSGQDCLAANRIYVQRRLYRDFCSAFAQRIAALKIGSGLEQGVEIGPLMHERAVSRTRARIDDALRRGARRLIGEALPPGPLFVTPALLVDVVDDALMMREETFAPVAAVTPFDSVEEVVERANATEYGLVAYVVTRDGARMLRLTRKLDFGMMRSTA